MRTNVRTFCKACSEALDLPGPVYEFGAFCYPEQAELANMRGFFKDKGYVGCDVQEGCNVDRVEDLEALTLPDESVGTAIALETLEHVQDIQKAFKELYRVLKKGGVLIVASPFIFPIHDVPNDYWRFTPKALAFLMKEFDVKFIGTHADPLNPHTVYGIGFKGCDRSQVIDRINLFYENFLQESRRPHKASYELSLFIKGLIKGREYVDNVRKRHLVKFDFYE